MKSSMFSKDSPSRNNSNNNSNNKSDQVSRSNKPFFRSVLSSSFRAISPLLVSPAVLGSVNCGKEPARAPPPAAQMQNNPSTSGGEIIVSCNKGDAPEYNATFRASETPVKKGEQPWFSFFLEDMGGMAGSNGFPPYAVEGLMFLNRMTDKNPANVVNVVTLKFWDLAKNIKIDDFGRPRTAGEPIIAAGKEYSFDIRTTLGRDGERVFTYAIYFGANNSDGTTTHLSCFPQRNIQKACTMVFKNEVKNCNDIVSGTVNMKNPHYQVGSSIDSIRIYESCAINFTNAVYIGLRSMRDDHACNQTSGS